MLQWGLDLGQVAKLLKATITIDFVEARNSRSYRKYLIIHDWGSVIGYILDTQKSKGYIHDIVSLDIGLIYLSKENKFHYLIKAI